jgi:hypothetical protein
LYYGFCDVNAVIIRGDVDECYLICGILDYKMWRWYIFRWSCYCWIFSINFYFIVISAFRKHNFFVIAVFKIFCYTKPFSLYQEWGSSSCFYSCWWKYNWWKHPTGVLLKTCQSRYKRKRSCGKKLRLMPFFFHYYIATTLFILKCCVVCFSCTKEIYSIKLPGDPKLGEGKPENQNHAIIFTRGDALQTIDMNQVRTLSHDNLNIL